MAAPVETVKLAPATAAGRSASIIVEMGQVVVVCLYATELAHGCRAPIHRKVNGLWQPVNEEDETAGFLDEGRREYVLTAPGEYSVDKPATPVAVGVMEIR